MRVSPARLLAAYYASDGADATAAADRLRAERAGPVWLSSGGASGSGLPREFNGFVRTLLPGEHLILAKMKARAVRQSVDELRRSGAPAVFILPPSRPSGGEGRKRPEAGNRDTIAHHFRSLAAAHGAPGSPRGRGRLLELLEQCDNELQLIREELLETARLEHTLTTSAEWFLDNHYLFDSTLR